MRAVLIEDFDSENLEITDPEKVHHLSKVVRVKAGENILILDGKGKKVFSTIDEISKKKIKIIIRKIDHATKSKEFIIALGKTKKDALDTNIKQAVELGISEIIIFDSEYSQKYELKHDRIERLITSAVEQSNSAFKPKVNIIPNIENIKFTGINSVFAFISERESSDNSKLTLNEKIMVIIGPEGGFSISEQEFLMQNSIGVRLDTNILRSTTALPTAIGYIHGKYI